MAQFGRPNATTSAGGGWGTESEGFDLHNSIDETVASDADHVFSSMSADSFTVTLSDINEAQSGTWTLRIRAKLDDFAASPNFTVVIKQGANTRATDTFTFSGTYASQEAELAGGEISSLSVTNGVYDTISVTVTAGAFGSGAAYVSWLELEAPDEAVASVPQRMLTGVGL